jgi:hypothetical protein
VGGELKKRLGGAHMKRITAIIRREKLDAVKHAIYESLYCNIRRVLKSFIKLGLSGIKVLLPSHFIPF